MRYALAALAAITLAAPVCAQSYNMDRSVMSSGGGQLTSSQYRISATLGQPVAGFVTGTKNLHWVGFWAADVPVPTVVSNINDAKKLRDGTLISIVGKIAVSGKNALTGLDDRFSGFFYIVDPNRTAGIRVSCTFWPVANLFRGSTVSVTGTLATTSTGERHLSGSIVVVGATVNVPTPLGMNNNLVGGGSLGAPPLGQYGAAGGFGLNNVGLLVKTWGRITASGAGYLVIDDGSGSPLRVDTTGLASVPTAGYVTVVGISSLDNGFTPAILPRIDADVR